MKTQLTKAYIDRVVEVLNVLHMTGTLAEDDINTDMFPLAICLMKGKK